ncbi:LysR family transcriptional regulator [Amycolatopsis jejuensis]|uniref:LysR family transcriptional regulator n=1 Tax=Amycolatopsis jejuensis TaxID=330084 RepID=UPI00068DCB44|nr:LysR family transcriptional regulator [Amycolatopsis jejuensis]
MDPRITLNQLQIFCRVVESRSVTQVARERGIAQPAVSAQLRSLERRIGAPLIHFNGKTMETSEAGEVVYAWARSVLDRTHGARRLIAELGNGSRGSVVVGASLSVGNYVLPKVLSEVYQELPGVLISLITLHPHAAVLALAEGRCDLAVVALESADSTPDITWEALRPDRLVPVAAPGHGHPEGPISGETLAGLPFVCGPKDQVHRQLIDGQFRHRGLPMRRVIMELGDPESIKTGVRAGIGVGLLSENVVESALEHGEITRLDLVGEPFEIPLWLGRRAQTTLTAAQHKVLDVIRAALGSG